MTDELNLEMRRLVERAVRDESPVQPALKRRVRRAVALAVPAGAAFGSGLAAAAPLGAGGTATALGAANASATLATTALGAANASATLAAAAASPVGVGLLHGFWGWVAGGFLLGMGATGAYAGWTAGWTESSTDPNARSRAVSQQSVANRTDSESRMTAASHEGANQVDAENRMPPVVYPSNATSGNATSGTMRVAARAGNPTADVDRSTLEPTSASAPAAAQTGAIRSAWTATAPGQAASLAEEVSLLARVQRELREGTGEAALATIDEATRRFPHSQLQPDLQAARVLALCQLGQVEHAQRAAASFLRGRVASPLTQRVQGSCAFASSGQPVASTHEH